MKHQAICSLLLAAAVWAQDVPVTLQVDVENQVRYAGDVTDPSRVAQSPAPVPVNPNRAVNFGNSTVIGDIIAVNGNPAKGAWAYVEHNIRLTPNPTVVPPGGAISDTMLTNLCVQNLEFVNPNGVSVGSIFGMGGVGGVKGWAIVGGTGALLERKEQCTQLAL